MVAVRSNSPAAEAGLRIGDLIAEVNGFSVTDESGSRVLHAYASTPLRKSDLPTVRLIIIRDGERRTLTLRLPR